VFFSASTLFSSRPELCEDSTSHFNSVKIRPVTRRGAEGLRLPLENVLDIVTALLRKLLGPLLVSQAGYGPG